MYFPILLLCDSFLCVYVLWCIRYLFHFIVCATKIWDESLSQIVSLVWIVIYIIHKLHHIITRMTLSRRFKANLPLVLYLMDVVRLLLTLCSISNKAVRCSDMLYVLVCTCNLLPWSACSHCGSHFLLPVFHLCIVLFFKRILSRYWLMNYVSFW